ncbi:MAG TPA: YicC/YloC family endoribonuclease [Gemmataceae bacterium]|nr:YicC/YloC family endoribonuclease [Gemmataceae bacterium]
MLLSMTGFGEARHQSDNLSIAVELRAVNNRYLKIITRASEPYNLFEPEVERVLRKAIRRGTLQVQIRAERAAKAADFRLNTTALRSYLEQLSQLGAEMRLDKAIVNSLLAEAVNLPGVAPEPGMASFQPEEEWPALERVLEEAIVRLQKMRQEEGQHMAQELLALRDRIAGELEQICQRIPDVAAGYRDRLLERVRGLLTDTSIIVQAEDLIKEVAIFADRSDIAEETVRLESHLNQFRDVVQEESDSPGRKLEFLVQEMGRETNTIGSKASDVAVSRHVVEIKATLEKIRELIQNVE